MVLLSLRSPSHSLSFTPSVPPFCALTLCSIPTGSSRPLAVLNFFVPSILPLHHFLLHLTGFSRPKICLLDKNQHCLFSFICIFLFLLAVTNHLPCPTESYETKVVFLSRSSINHLFCPCFFYLSLSPYRGLFC